ncbi:hypothetical protein LCGC14_2902800, partial [marine sediment metagenome]
GGGGLFSESLSKLGSTALTKVGGALGFGPQTAVSSQKY